jgi:hypothetical protein
MSLTTVQLHNAGLTQFTAVSLLYLHLGTLSSGQFLVADLVNTLPLVLALDVTDSAAQLRPGLPFTKLCSVPFVIALVGHCAIAVCGQLMQLWFLSMQPWYVPTTSAMGESGTYFT